MPVTGLLAGARGYGMFGAPGFAAPSYDSLATVTSGGSSNTLTFSSIPSGYASLQIRGIVRESLAGSTIADVFLRLNSDTGSNYSYQNILGDGSNITTASAASQTLVALSRTSPYNGNTANSFSAAIIDIDDYASTTRNKTIRAYHGVHVGANGGFVVMTGGLWRSTNAITSISLSLSAGSNFVSGSTFSLYGIRTA